MSKKWKLRLERVRLPNWTNSKEFRAYDRYFWFMAGFILVCWIVLITLTILLRVRGCLQ